MLTYDSVLEVQERIENPSPTTMNESVGETVKYAIDTIVQKGVAILDTLIELVNRAATAFTAFLRESIATSRKQIAEFTKKGLDNEISVAGFTLRGYTFRGLNNAIKPYRAINVDDFMAKMGLPRVDTYDKLAELVNNGPAERIKNALALFNDENALYHALVKTMLNADISGDTVQESTASLMNLLWGSSKPQVLRGEKDFTIGGEVAKLVAPPLARSIIMSYKNISKKLYGTKKLLGMVPTKKIKNKTEAGKIHEVRKELTDNPDNSDEVVDLVGMFLRRYIISLKNMSRMMNELNKALLKTITAQRQQSKYIIERCLLVKGAKGAANAISNTKQNRDDDNKFESGREKASYDY